MCVALVFVWHVQMFNHSHLYVFSDLCRQQISELELTVESITVEKARLLRDNESLQLSLTDHEQVN